MRSWDRVMRTNETHRARLTHIFAYFRACNCSLTMAFNEARLNFLLRSGLGVTLVHQRMLHLVHFFLDFIFQ